MGRAQRRREGRRAPARSASKVEQERLRQLLVIVGVGLVVLAAVVIAAFGYYQTQIAVKSKTILRVGETRFSLGHFERRLGLAARTDPTFLQALDSAPDAVLSQLEREGVLFEAAPPLDVEVSDEDVDAEIRRHLGLPEEGDERTFAARYGEEVRSSGLHTDEYRSRVRASLLEERLLEKFSNEAPAAETQARARLILVQTEEEAREVIRRLEAGEDFAALAKELSLDQSTKDQGGETDWLLRAGMVESVGEFLFTAEVGARSGPLAVANAYFIVELLERQDQRELSEEQKELVANRNYGQWLEDARAGLEIVRSLTPEDQAEALASALEEVSIPTQAAGGGATPTPTGGDSGGQ